MKRPVSVSLVAYAYIAAGVIGFAYHFPEFTTGEGLGFGVFGIEVIRIAAVVCGVFLLRGQNWARWLAVAWIGFHAVISAFHTVPELAVHCLFFAVTAWLLFRPAAGAYFRSNAGHVM